MRERERESTVENLSSHVEEALGNSDNFMRLDIFLKIQQKPVRIRILSKTTFAFLEYILRVLVHVPSL